MPQFRTAAPLITVFTYLTTSASIAIADQPPGSVEEVYVTGGAESIRSLSGSATLLDQDSIAKFETTDLNALLTKVPGVYIRQEDGYGLRPNINLRGTSSDRSSKLTIMEDSILIGPAPYSAPAAYYIPNVARMAAVEVVKGPKTVAYGPHSVGGAINFVTRPLPSEPGGELNILVGEDGNRKAHVHYGNASDQFSYWVDALHYGADGFKELDTGGDTGFTRNDLNAKLAWKFGKQTITAKIGYADEDADETYLGLTDSDFEENPNRRYAASQLDRFITEHHQIHLNHNIAWSEQISLSTSAYWNAFERAWNRFDGVLQDESLISGSAILSLPGFFAQEYAIITGQLDSSDDNGFLVDVTNNDRSFTSTGIQSKLNWLIEGDKLSHDIDLGFRLHHDEVNRDHSQRAYLIESSQLIFDGNLSRPDKQNNDGEVTALALYAIDTLSIGKLKLNAGLRFEHIESSFEERAPGAEISQEESYSFISPGLGAYYAVSEDFGLLAGVNKGFSPNSASASLEAVPEESINYEAGLRYEAGTASIEAIGFFSDYENLLGRCRASDACAGEEFNGGAVEVYGLELSGSEDFLLAGDWSIPVQLIYTYTESEFVTSFDSSFVQWGSRVEAGFELPYLPKHQASLEFGLAKNSFGIDFAVNYVDKMREIAGDGAIESADFTEALTTVNMSIYGELNEALTLKLLVDNLGGEQQIISRRPFGARPNQPRTVKLSANYRF